MKLTKRGKRRLLMVTAIVVALAALGGAALGVRAYLTERRIQQAREHGVEHHAAGRYREAIRALGQYYGRYPDDIEAALLLADARLRVPEPDGRHVRASTAVYRSVLERDTDNRTALEGLLGIFRQIGRRVDMMDIAERLVAIDPAHEGALMALIAGHMASGAFEPAKLRASQLTRIDPDRYEYREVELGVLERSGADFQALSAYCDALMAEQKAADGRWLVLRGILRYRFQQSQSGRADLLEAARLGVERDVFEYLLWSLEQIGERDTADEFLTSTRGRFPDEWWPVEVAVRREWVHGRPDLAQTTLDSALAAMKTEPTPAILRWQALLATVRQDDAQVSQLLARLEEAAAAMPSDERDLTNAWGDAIEARREANTGRWREALRAYDSALGRLQGATKTMAAGVDVAVLFHLQGEALAALGETPAAMVAFRRAYEETRRMWIVPGVGLAESLLRMGRLDEAFITVHDMTRSTRPSVIGPYLSLGRIWLAVEQAGIALPDLGRQPAWPDALTFLQSLYEGTGGTADVLPLLAQAMWQRGDAAGLRALLAQAASQGNVPDRVKAQLAHLAVDARVEIPAALAEAAGSDDAAMDLAWARARALGRSGRIEAGLAELDRVVDLQASSPPMKWRLNRVRYLEEFDLPSVREALSDLLNDPSLPSDALDMLLSLNSTWRDAETLGRALSRLESIAPPGSSRLILGRAQYTLRFDADNQQALAAALADVDGLRERGGGDSVAVLTTLARLHLAIGPGNRRMAAGLLRQTVERWPQQTTLYPQLIALLQELGEFSSAERYLRQFETYRGADQEVSRAAASLFARQGDFEAAVARFDVVARASGEQTDRLTLAAWRLRAGRYDEAWALLDELVRETPCSPMAVLLAVQHQVARGNWSRAESILNNAALERESLRLMLWGAYHVQRGDHATAQQFLLRAAESDPDNVTTSVWLARHAMMQGKADEAIRIASAALQRHPEEEDLRLLIAAAALGGDESARREALSTFEQLRGDNTALVETVRLFSRVVSSDGSMSRKVEDLRAASELASKHPTFLPAARLAFMLHRIAGDTDGARRVAEQAMLRMPGDPEPAQWMTEILIDRGELERALTNAEAWRRRSLADPYEASIVLASIALDLKNFNRAYEVLAPMVERFRAERRRDPRGFERWVVTLMLAGRIDEAYREVVEDMSGDEGVFSTWLSNAQTLSGDLASAALNRAAEQAVSFERRLHLALAWATVGQRIARQPQGAARAAMCFTRAREAVQSAVGSSEPTPEALRTIAIITAAEGRTEEAVSQYRELLRRDPNDPIALNNLAMLLVTAVSRADEALPLSERLVGLHGDVPDFLDTHALVLMHAGRLDDSLQTIDLALARQAENPALLLTRARILIRRGDATGARSIVSRVESLLRHALIVPVEVADALDEIRASLQASAPPSVAWSQLAA